MPDATPRSWGPWAWSALAGGPTVAAALVLEILGSPRAWSTRSPG